MATPTHRRRAKSFLRNYYGIQQTDVSNANGSGENPSTLTFKSSKSDPYDLDSHAFEVDKYMHKIFVEKQLPGLVQTDNDLVADIRQLDGDMKTLVYENYSKFLSATDTINKMKSNVDNLESEMSRLTYNIGKIADSSSSIHKSLGGKREKIRQLNGVHSLLTKLQFVFELPMNLHQCLEAESYSQAVKSYCRTLHVLQHYKHLTVFTGIERECKTIMVQIAQKIRQKMCGDKATITEISDSVGLLLALKEDPVALWRQYLELSVSCLGKAELQTLEEIKNLPLYVAPTETNNATSPNSNQAVSPSTPAKTPKKTKVQVSDTGISTPKRSKAKGPSSSQLADKTSYLNAVYLEQVENFVTLFRSYFLATPSAGTNPNSTADNKGDSGLEAERTPWSAQESRVHLSPAEHARAMTSVQEAISKIVGSYMDLIESFLHYPDNIFDIQPEVHVHILQSLYSATLSSSSLCFLIGFDALAKRQIQQWESKLIGQTFGVIKTGLLERIQDPKVNDTALSTSGASLDASQSHQQHLSTGEERSELTMLTRDIMRWLVDIIRNDAIPFLESCMGSDAHFLETAEGRAQFLKIVQDGFKGFWDQVLHEMKHTATLTKSSTTTSLIVSHVCIEMSSSVVELLYKTLSKTIFRAGRRNRSGSFLIESYEEPPVASQLQWDFKAVVQACQETGHALLDDFISRSGNELSWLITDVQSDTNYIAMQSPPSQVSAAWQSVCQQLNAIDRLVIRVYGDEGDQGIIHEVSSDSTRRETVFKSLGGDRGSSSGIGNGNRASHRNDSLTSFGSNAMNSRFDNQQRNMLLSNIDKLFSDRVEIFVRCQDLTRTGIMFGIIKILLKAWAEFVRSQTFGRGGFQQVQVDAEFAKVWLWRFATTDERLMHSLLEEAQQTAYRRCIDAVPLDPATVEAVIGQGQRVVD
ncbi:Vacuolar protein sorting-associated protein 51 [Podila epigama]|nr:Vacuolar protein sorting-associated protein 51 [Podila epigama]